MIRNIFSNASHGENYPSIDGTTIHRATTAVYGFVFVVVIGVLSNLRVLCVLTLGLPKDRNNKLSRYLIGNLGIVNLLSSMFWLSALSDGESFVTESPIIKKLIAYFWDTILTVFPTNLVLLHCSIESAIRGNYIRCRITISLIQIWLYTLFISIVPWIFQDHKNALERYHDFRFGLYFVGLVIYFGIALYKIREKFAEFNRNRQLGMVSPFLCSLIYPRSGLRQRKFVYLGIYTFFLNLVWFTTWVFPNLQWAWAGYESAIENRDWFYTTFSILEQATVGDWVQLVAQWVAMLFLYGTTAVFLCMLETSVNWRWLIIPGVSRVITNRVYAGGFNAPESVEEYLEVVQELPVEEEKMEKENNQNKNDDELGANCDKEGKQEMEGKEVDGEGDTENVVTVEAGAGSLETMWDGEQPSLKSEEVEESGDQTGEDEEKKRNMRERRASLKLNLKEKEDDERFYDVSGEVMDTWL